MILHLSTDVPVDRYRNVLCSDGSRNFKTGGGGGRILRSGVCFDTPLHIPYVIVVRVGNKIHIVNIVFWLKSKYFRVSPLRFTKFQTGVRAPDARVLDPPLLCCFTCYWLSHLDIIITVWHYRYLSVLCHWNPLCLEQISF